MIDEYLDLTSKRIYPSKKEWFFKYGKHGNEYQKLLEYKKTNLTQIDLYTTEGSIYFNRDYIQSFVKEYYQTQDLGIDSLIHFSETFEDILIFSEVEGTLEIEGIKTSKKKIEDVLSKDTYDSNEQIIVNMKNGIDFIFEN